ncbi:MTUS1 protein, partial [Arenaria interpres]|nr:MTUS1 protein [Arenaria interpres]
KAKKSEIVSFPKPNFKNVKPKVMSRLVLQSRDSTGLKESPQSPQLSAASSPSLVASPRQLSPSVKVLKKKIDLAKDTKVELPVNKAHKLHLNKHLFASQVVHATTHPRNASHKASKTPVLKQNPEDVGKASSTPSACSSVSAALPTCAETSKVMLNDKTGSSSSLTQPCAQIICPNGGEREESCNTGILLEAAALKEVAEETFDLHSVPLMPSVKDGTTQGKNILKKDPVTLQGVSTPKVKMMPSVVPLKKGCENKTISAIKAPSHKGAVLSSSSRTASLPREKQASVKNSPASWATPGKLLAKSKAPVKRLGLERTPSISSVSSTQSERSLLSSNSANATVIIKNGEWPSKPACQNGTLGSAPVKAGPRPRIHSLKSTPKGLALRQEEVCVFSSVDKGKQRSANSSCIQAQAATDAHSPGTKPAELTQYKTKCEAQSGIILQLKKFLTCSNQKFEALTVVIQYLQSE